MIAVCNMDIPEVEAMQTTTILGCSVVLIMVSIVYGLQVPESPASVVDL